MTTYTATFSNGQTISLKNSTRKNTCAWQAIVTHCDGTTWTRTGWSSHPALAEKAARACGTYRQPKWWGRVPETRGKVFAPDIVAVEVVAL